MRGTAPSLRRSLAAPSVLVAAAAVVLAGCSSSPSSSPSTTKPSAASAKTEITRNWEAFFAGTTPASRKIALLQNGSEFAQVIRAQASSSIAKSASAKVLKVTITSGSSATVRYSVYFGSQPALSNQTGTAVLDHGTWKVGTASFCALLALQGTKVPACSSSKG